MGEGREQSRPSLRFSFYPPTSAGIVANVLICAYSAKVGICRMLRAALAPAIAGLDQEIRLYHAYICLHIATALLGYAVSEKITCGEAAAGRIVGSAHAAVAGYLECAASAQHRSLPE